MTHLVRARDNGVTQEKLIETIHLAFYAGWPNANSAITVTKEVFEKPDAATVGVLAFLLADRAARERLSRRGRRNRTLSRSLARR
jgi:hypothetical protein